MYLADVAADDAAIISRRNGRTVPSKTVPGNAVRASRHWAKPDEVVAPDQLEHTVTVEVADQLIGARGRGVEPEFAASHTWSKRRALDRADREYGVSDRRGADEIISARGRRQVETVL
jgi:hypothetical protein